jgi:hypothetical protein
LEAIKAKEIDKLNINLYAYCMSNTMTSLYQAQPSKTTHTDFLDYHKYLLSPDWKAKKQHQVKLFGNKCFSGCGRKAKALHHRHYKNLGTEPPHQLVLLCDSCHYFVHGLPDNFITSRRQMKLNLRKLLRKYSLK